MAFLARSMNGLCGEPFVMFDALKFGLWLKVAHFSSITPNSFLSEENKRLCVERFQKMSASLVRKTSIDSPCQKAAVLVPVCCMGDELALVYTLRTHGVNRHRGQVSFPGGMYDESDVQLEQTAIRETNEELGIPAEDIKIWGKGHELEVRGIAITPVLGYVGNIDVDNLNINKSEVEFAFLVSIRHLCDPENFRYTQFKDGVSTPVYLKARCRIWGITAMITHIFLKSWSPNSYNNSLNYVKPIQR